MTSAILPSKLDRAFAGRRQAGSSPSGDVQRGNGCSALRLARLVTIASTEDVVESVLGILVTLAVGEVARADVAILDASLRRRTCHRRSEQRDGVRDGSREVCDRGGTLT